jgi:hypothetical protein
MASFPLSYVPISPAEFEQIATDQFKVVLNNLAFRTDHLTSKEAKNLLRQLDKDLVKELESLIEKARDYHNLLWKKGNDIEKDNADRAVYEALQKVLKTVDLYREKHNIKYS